MGPLLIMFTAIGHLTGLGLGFGTVLASHIAFCIPIVVIVVLPQLNEMNNNILNAARFRCYGITNIWTCINT